MLADINALRGELASLKQERRANNQHGISTIEPEFASVLSSIERSRDVWNNDRDFCSIRWSKRSSHRIAVDFTKFSFNT